MSSCHHFFKKNVFDTELSESYLGKTPIFSLQTLIMYHTKIGLIRQTDINTTCTPQIAVTQIYNFKRGLQLLSPKCSTFSTSTVSECVSGITISIHKHNTVNKSGYREYFKAGKPLSSVTCKQLDGLLHLPISPNCIRSTPRRYLGNIQYPGYNLYVTNNRIRIYR